MKFNLYNFIVCITAIKNRITMRNNICINMATERLFPLSG